MKTVHNTQSDEPPPAGSSPLEKIISETSLDPDKILSDFDALKQEINAFKSQMTIDDFYFYERERPRKFEKQMTELCEKHFASSWESLDDKLIEWFHEASANKKTKLKNNVQTLNTYFFGTDFSYHKKYEIEYEDDPDEEPDWKGRVCGKARKFWKGEYEVRIKRQENTESFKETLKIRKPATENVFLKNWKQIVTALICNQWDTFNGNYDSSKGIWRSAYRENRKLTTTDYICFLALKNTLRSDLQIVTNENEILIIVSGGIAAKIAIRKTGNFVLKILQSEQQIYSMTKFSWKEEQDYEYSEKTLLHISGYTDSQINIHIPNGYYFVGDKYIVQLEFIAAPILLNNLVISMASADHSSLSLLEDEEEQKRRDEEDY